MKTKQDARDALSLYGDLQATDMALEALQTIKPTDTFSVRLGNDFVLSDAPMGMLISIAIRKELALYWTKRRSVIVDELRQRGFEQ